MTNDETPGDNGEHRGGDRGRAEAKKRFSKTELGSGVQFRENRFGQQRGGQQ